MDELYGPKESQGLRDEDWIRDVSSQGMHILCKDPHIAKRPLEARAVYYSDARVFTLNAGQLTAEAMIARFIGNETRIMRMAETRGPYVVAVGVDGIRRLVLAAP